MPEPALNHGCKEILFRKLFYSIVIAVLLQLLFLITFLLVININIFEPILWIQQTFLSLTSFNVWLYFTALGTAIFVEGIIHSRGYVTESSYYNNRVLKFLSLFSIRNFFVVSLHLITGSLIVCLYLVVIGNKTGSSCFQYEISKGYCLKEPCFFVLLNGIWIDFYYFVKNSSNNDKGIVFPVVHQRKFLMVKASIGSKLKQALKMAVRPSFYFILLYYFRGVSIRHWFLQIFNLRFEDPELKLLDPVNCALYLYCLFFSTLFIFNLLFMNMLFEIFLTEHLVFPIYSEYGVLTLKEALSTRKIPIVQHLACLDLYLLSLWDRQRRQELFTLSQPGGHPHNWNNILQEVLKLLSEFSADISTAIEPPIPELPEPIPEEPAQEPLAFSPARSPGLRNMSLPRQEPLNIIEVQHSDVLKNATNRLTTFLSTLYNTYLSAIKRTAAVQYFFGDLPESRIYFLLGRGQPIIWAVQGLALTVSASLTEDHYGVVQKDLPVILTTLIQLKQNLDKLNKFNISGRKNAKSEIAKNQLTTALRSAVKRSLYNICNKFGDYLTQLQLNKEVCQQLQAFVTYREG